MGIAIGEEHEALAATVRRWCETRGTVGVARAALDAESDGLDELWPELGPLGWTGLAVSEADGGQGYGLSELAVVLEELGRGCLPGPFLSTVVVAVALDRWGSDPELVARLAAGTVPAGLALSSELEMRGAGVSGRAAVVWNGATAEVLLVPVQVDGATVWGIVDRADVSVRDLPSFDRTRRLVEVTLDQAALPAARRLAPGAPVEALATLLAGAELVGVADWCVSTAATYATERVQFGRPIGQFQAVKHRCADMLVDVEGMRSTVYWAAWCIGADDADASVAASTAKIWCGDASKRVMASALQVHGGIGFTWEHDLHFFLKRAQLDQLAFGDASAHRARLASLLRPRVEAGESVV